MTGLDVLDIARDGIWVMIIVSAPMMIVGLVVGVIIALFQALTQIQEMTLVFVPKIIAIFVAMLVALPFMGATMAGYMSRVVDLIVVGDRRSNEEWLRLPHPRAAERAFVLQPWYDLEPDAEIPDHGRVADLLGKTGDQGLQRRDDLVLANPA